MSRLIDLYSYDYDKLLKKTMEYCKTDNKELVEKVFNYFGTKIDTRYIILNQELWEEGNCYYNISTILDKLFNVEDSFGEIFCNFNNKLDEKELISAVDLYGAEEEFGVEDESECY